uniref:Secreted protein n=1 Tax=Anguilla anguilla TaxID=7936 RepID=A0A0E9X697_ANGAN
MHSLSLHCCFLQQTVILILWSLFLTSIVQTKINTCRDVRSHVTQLHLCNYTCAQLFSHRNTQSLFLMNRQPQGLEERTPINYSLDLKQKQ